MIAVGSGRSARRVLRALLVEIEGVADRCSKSRSIIEFKVFPGRSKWTLAQPGWDEVADYAPDWAPAKAGDRTNSAV